jgi:hypothetical protein
MGVDPNNLPSHLLRCLPAAELARLARQPMPGLPAELRQVGTEAPLNKTEAAYLEWLKTLEDTRIWVQCWGLRLSGLGGDRCFYYPDFAALDSVGLRFIDTKATWKDGKVHIEDDALVKMKWAAQLYAPLPFMVAWRNGGVWHHKRISPGTKL